MKLLKIQKGDLIKITYANKTVNAVVEISSENNVSLFVTFHAFLDGYVGGMAILYDERSEKYIDIFKGKEVIIQQ